MPSPARARLLAAAFTGARDATAKAAAIELAFFRSPDLEVDHKLDSSPVTAADRGAEAAIRDCLALATPECGMLGEELGASGPSDCRWIVDPLDATANFVAGIPYFAILLGLEIDGALELGFVHAPALGTRGQSWWGVRGLGAFHCDGLPRTPLDGARLQVGARPLAGAQISHGGLEVMRRAGLGDALGRVVDRAARSRGFGDWWGHCLVAEGRVDAMIEGAVAYHDVAALVPLIEMAGGVVVLPPDATLGPGYDRPFVSATPTVADELRELLFA